MTMRRTGLGARGMRAGFSFMREGDEGGGGGNTGGKPPEGVTETDEDDDSAGDDDEDDDDEDDDDSGDDDEPLKDGGKKALQRERERNKELRRQLRELRNSNGDKGGDDKGGDVEAKAAERALELAKPVVIRSTASAALKEAGLLGDASKAIRLLDFSSIDVEIDAKTGEVEIDGLDDQIDELKEDFPHLFETKRKTPGRIDGAEKKNGSDRKTLSATERQAQQLTRSGRR